MIDLKDVINERELPKELEELFQKIYNKQVGLFVGAGFSKLSGGPLGSDLVKSIHEKFSDHKENENLLSLCDDILLDGEENREQIEKIVKMSLAGILPHDTHLLSMAYEWAGIYTTNYDNLIELAIKKNYPTEEIKIIIDPITLLELDSRPKTHIYKLMGDINIEKDIARIIISTSDFNINMSHRARIFNKLSSEIKGGPLLYLGYSFSDKLAETLIREIIRAEGREKFSKSFVLFRSKKSEKIEKQFKKLNIELIYGDIEDFFKILHSNFPPKDRSIQSKYQLSIMGNTFNMSPHKFLSFSSKFEILTDESRNAPMYLKENFFQGDIHDWCYYENELDFKRNIFLTSDGIWNKFFDMVKFIPTNYKEFVRVMYIIGPPGSGKSVIGRRLAFDSYYNLNLPVIFLKGANIYFRNELFEFIEEIYIQFPDYNNIDCPLVLFIDHTIFYGNRIISLIEKFQRDKFNCVIVLIDRESEWSRPSNNITAIIKKIKSHEIHIPLKFTENEKNRFLTYLKEIGYGELTSLPAIANLEDGFYSFYASLYTTIVATQNPLQTSVLDQYNQIFDDELKIILENVMLFNIFGVNAPISLLQSRGLFSKTYDNFMEKTESHEVRGILFYHEEGRYEYLTFHSRLISEILLEQNEYDKNWFISRFKKLLENSRLWGYDQIITIETILISYISSRDRNIIPIWKNLSLKTKIDMFNIAIKHNKNRNLMHHLGKLLSRDGQFDLAINSLQIALDLNPRETYDDEEKIRFESDQFIHNTLATVFAKKGLLFLKNKNQNRANFEFQRSIQNFKLARNRRSLKFSSPSFHAEATYLYLKKIPFINNNEEKLLTLTAGLDILSRGLFYIKEDPFQLTIFEDALIKFQIELNKLQEDLDWFDLGNLLYEKYDSILGFTSILSMIYEHLTSKTSLILKFNGDLYEYIMSFLVKAFDLLGNRVELLRYQLKFHLLKELNLMSENEFYKSLKYWFNNKSTNFDIILELEYGKLSFLLGDYEESRYVFKQLRWKVRNLPSQFEIQTYALDENLKIKRFIGKIVRFPLKRNQLGLISLKVNENDHYIGFKIEPTIKEIKPFDNVSFDIGFSYSGPIAFNISIENKPGEENTDATKSNNPS